MDEDPKICRLCLKIIEKDVTYFPLTNNDAVLENLKLLPFVTVKSLQLTKDPLICKVCDNKLKQLTTLKENIVSNELQIQKNSEDCVAVSNNYHKVCRLCLKASEDTELEKKWEDSKDLFIKCNINLNLNAPEPSKICNPCDETLQNMLNFVLSCSENEERIVDEASQKVSLKNLVKVSNRGESSEKDRIGEDNNNVSEEQESLRKASSSELSASNPENQNTGNELPGKNETKLNNESSKLDRENKSNQDEKSDGQNANYSTELSVSMTVNTDSSESLVFNKTPNTYTRTKSKLHQATQVKASKLDLNILSDICLKKQNEPSTSKFTHSDNNINQIEYEFLGDMSIDASPVRNVRDITLDMSIGRFMEVESSETEKINDTQELRALLEGTEEQALSNNEKFECVSYDKQYKNTEDLLKDLEDDTGEDVIGVVMEMSDNTKKSKGKHKKIESPKVKIHENIVKTDPIVIKVSEVSILTADVSNNPSVNKTSPVLEKIKNVKASGSKRNISAQERSAPKRKNTRILNIKSSSPQADPKKHNLRQKSIVTSFREMLNMKPHKNNLPGSTENLTESGNQKDVSPDTKKTDKNLQSEGPVKGGAVKRKGRNNSEHKEENISQEHSLSSNLKEKNTSKELQSAEIVSQIQSTSFDKIQLKKISLVDDEISSENPQAKDNNYVQKKRNKVTGNNMEGQGKNVIKKLQRVVKNKQPVPTVEEINGDSEKETEKRKATLDSQGEAVPKKRAKRLIQQKLSTNNEQVSTSNEQIKEKKQYPPSAKKRQLRANKETPESKGAKATEPKQTNGDDNSQSSKEIDSESEDDGDSEPATKTSDKSVVVTIIRRNKTKNKAQRDKTWQELTGKPILVKVEEREDDQPKKKRGRPPLPDSEKKPKKPKPKYFLCDFCPFKSISQNIIIQHQFIHNVVDDVSQFKCGQCGFRANNEETVEQHKLSHLMLEIIYKCMFCEYSHKKKNSTMYHTLRHEDRDLANMFYCLVVNQMTDEEQYECFQCEYQNTEEAVMPDHVMDHQVEEIKNPIMTKFACKECLYKTKFENLFKRHMERHEETRKKQKGVKKEVKTEAEDAASQSQDESQEEELPVYSCKQCQYLTYNKRSLSNHTGLKHTRYSPPDAKLEERRRKKKIPLPDEIYQCNECDYVTQKKAHLTRHMIIHRSKENMEFYECTHCIFETKHRRSYKRHMEAKHKVIV